MTIEPPDSFFKLQPEDIQRKEDLLRLANGKFVKTCFVGDKVWNYNVFREKEKPTMMSISVHEDAFIVVHLESPDTDGISWEEFELELMARQYLDRLETKAVLIKIEASGGRRPHHRRRDPYMSTLLSELPCNCHEGCMIGCNCNGQMTDPPGEPCNRWGTSLPPDECPRCGAPIQSTPLTPPDEGTAIGCTRCPWPKPEPPPPEREYSGRFIVRLPKWLHKSLAESADREGVSLNQHVTALLSAAEGRKNP